MRRVQDLIAAVILVWAGLSLGGNLIAAPAKFQVSGLSMVQLVTVGRAQFAWLGLVELIFAAALIMLALVTRRMPHWALGTALVLLFIQQFMMTPVLQARSDMMQLGAVPPESQIHLAYVALEVIKFICLATAGWRGLANFCASGDRQPANSPSP